MQELKDKVVLIAGASRGIGAAAAREFARVGAMVALVARSEQEIAAIAQQIRDDKGRAIAVSCDVANRAQVEAAVADTVAEFGRLDVLIGNAGMLEPVARLEAMDPDGWDRVIDVNVKGIFYGIHAALPHMKDGGTIITIGSGAASSALEGWSHYCASKAAVHHLSACLDAEMRHKGIRALVLSPGTVATEMQKVIKASGLNPVSKLAWEDHIPPEWPARTLVWMCSKAADPWRGKVVALRDDAIRRAVGLTQ